MPILRPISKYSDKNFNMILLGVFLRISYQSLCIEFPDYFQRNFDVLKSTFEVGFKGLFFRALYQLLNSDFAENF